MRRQAGYELLEPEDWKARLREGAEKDGGLPAAAVELAETHALMKSIVCDVQKATDQERVLEFIISTGAVDRDWDRINPKGWDLKAYRKNPVILWAHNSRMPPIGRSLKVTLEDDALVARAEFMPAELSPFADAVFQMLSQRWMRTASVGFRPKEVSPAEEEERRQRYGLDFVKQELLEWSVVPIPANAEALMRAHEAGVNTRPIKAWAEQVLDLREPLPGLGLNDIEAAWKAVKGPDRLVVWVEAEEKGGDPEGEPAAEPTPDPEPATEPGTEPLPQAASAEITFARRPDGAYTVLRGGQAVLVVESPDAVEWDEDGVLRLAESPDQIVLADLEIEEPGAPEGDELLVEVDDEPEEAKGVDFDIDALAAALGQALGDQLSAALTRT